MLLMEQRRRVVEYSRKMAAEGLSGGTFGNLSLLDRDSGLIAITPSGMDYFRMEPADIVVVTAGGERVEGEHRPSTELDLHCLLYRSLPDVGAVVHTHSAFATVLACLRWDIEPIHYLAAGCGGRVPCIPYLPFGSKELARAAVQAMGQEYQACLLGGHGLLAAGRDLEQAYSAAQQTEFLAQIYYYARLAGGGVTLTQAELQDAKERFRTYRSGAD